MVGSTTKKKEGEYDDDNDDDDNIKHPHVRNFFLSKFSQLFEFK